MPVDFTTAGMPDVTVAAVARLYAANGGAFLLLGNKSAYPPADFFNSQDHLAKPCQYLHSIAVAGGLGALLHKTVLSPPTPIQALAAACP
jgi:hypothetical protein